jgi:taurine transport system permease protein
MLIKKPRPVYYLVITYFFLWIIFFEFILPVNKILPKPSIVLESFPALWSYYNLPANFLATVSTVYISLFLAYLLVKFLSPYLKEKDNSITVFINSLEWFSQYLPGIIIGLLLIFWFPNSAYIEFVFAFATAFISIMIKFQNESDSADEEYIISAKSLGLNENEITKKIIWKNVEPKLMEHVFSLHLYLWSLIIIFEFIKDSSGLGVIFRQALEYQDLSAIFSVFLITGITIFLGTLLLKYFKKKFVFWR